MEYITIAEYAERAGVSKQTAYNRSKRDKYKGYFRKVKGVLMVDDSIFQVKENFNVESILENQADGAKTNFPFNDNSRQNSSPYFELIENQKKQIEIMNKRIDDLFSMIAEKDSIIKDLTSQIGQLTASFPQLLHERNMIEAGNQVMDRQNIEQEQIHTEQSPSKKGIFSRLLRRK